MLHFWFISNFTTAFAWSNVQMTHDGKPNQIHLKISAMSNCSLVYIGLLFWWMEPDAVHLCNPFATHCACGLCWVISTRRVVFSQTGRFVFRNTHRRGKVISFFEVCFSFVATLTQDTRVTASHPEQLLDMRCNIV